MFAQILIFPILLSQACFQVKETLLFVITENENIRVNLSEVFIGNNIFYSTSADLKIIEPFNEYEKIQLPEQTYPISFKPLLNMNLKWINQFAYMAQNFNFVNITFSDPQINFNTLQFKTVLQLEKQDLNCFDFDYFREDSFIIVCQRDTQNLLYIHHKNGDLENQIELKNYLNIKSIQITNTQQYFYKLESNQHQSILAIYNWNQNQSDLTLSTLISNETIHQLFPYQESISLRINKYKILKNNIIYFLDQNLGLFKFKDDHITMIKADQIISFDIDNENGYLIYLQTQKIVIYHNYYNIRTIHLDIIVDETAKVHISGQYVILHNKGYFSSYSIDSGYLLQKFYSEGIITYLSSSNYLLTLSNEFSHFYLLTNGYLILKADDFETKNKMIKFLLQGKDINGVCNTTINLQIIQENSDILISEEVKNFIVVGSPTHQQEFQLMISGPNRNYYCVTNCAVQHIINYPFSIQLKDQLIFQDIIKINNIDYYLIQQFQKSDQLIINKCVLISQFFCQSYLTMQMKIQANENNLQSQIIDGNIYFVVLENSLTISLQTTNSTIKQLSFVKNIKQILFRGSSLYLIFDTQIQFYKNIILNNEFILIDNSFINKCSYSISWNPQRLYLNQKGDTLFIINHGSLLIANLFSDFYIKYYLNIEISENDHLVISDKTFILIKDNILFEYNYYQEVYLIHKVPTYQNQLFQPINIKSCNDYLLIQTEQQDILVYQFKTQAHNSLKMQIQLTNAGFKTQGQQILFSPFTSELQLYILMYSNELILKMIYENPIISYNFESSNNNYIQETTTIIKVYNNKHSLLLNQQVKYINTYTSISFLEKELKEQNKVYLQKYEQKIPMIHKWYEGQVIDFMVESEIDKVVTIQNLLEKTENLLSNRQQFNSLISISNVTKILQGTSSFLEIDSQFELISLINLDVKPQFNCIQTIKVQDFFYTLCNNQSVSYLHVTKVNDGFPLGFLYQFEGFTKKIGNINNKILFLIDYTLRIGDISQENGNFYIKNIYQINYIYLKLKSPFKAIDFDITEIEGNEYIIQILDQSGIVAILRGLYQDNNYVVFNLQTFDAKDILKRFNFFILSDTSFIFIQQLHHLKSIIQNLCLLLITNNAGSYGIRIIYDDNPFPTLEFMIIQYGFWQTQRFYIGTNTIAISYKNQNKVFIGIYKINFDQQNIDFKQYPINSGIQIDQLSQDPIFFFLNNNYLVVDSQNQVFQEYQINDYVYFFIKGAQDRQHVNITAKNDFNSNSMNFVINYNIDDELSNTWWIVLLSVSGGAILIAICFYIYKRMHPVKSVSSILLE